MNPGTLIALGIAASLVVIATLWFCLALAFVAHADDDTGGDPSDREGR